MMARGKTALKREMKDMSEETKKKGLFARLREGLSRTRGSMTEKVDEMVRDNRKVDEDFYEELEDILVMADCGLKATTAIIDELRRRHLPCGGGRAADRLGGPCPRADHQAPLRRRPGGSRL